MALKLGCLDRSRYFSYKHVLSYLQDGEQTPFQTRYFSENLIALGIERRTSGPAARNSEE
jgi:hypothetical protein